MPENCTPERFQGGFSAIVCQFAYEGGERPISFIPITKGWIEGMISICESVVGRSQQVWWESWEMVKIRDKTASASVPLPTSVESQRSYRQFSYCRRISVILQY